MIKFTTDCPSCNDNRPLIWMKGGTYNDNRATYNDNRLNYNEDGPIFGRVYAGTEPTDGPREWHADYV